jgi:hypothetical protein
MRETGAGARWDVRGNRDQAPSVLNTTSGIAELHRSQCELAYAIRMAMGFTRVRRAALSSAAPSDLGEGKLTKHFEGFLADVVLYALGVDTGGFGADADIA